MISPENQISARGADNVSYNVSCFDDSYASDDDLSVEQSTHVNKRQKMTEEERLTRCRERNRVHARNTRERKKSQMDGLQSRIQELVDEKKRLNSSVSESSVASILMSLAGFDIPNAEQRIKSEYDCKEFYMPQSFKVDDDEDDISLSIEKLKMQVSALLGDEDCKDALDTDPILAKDKSTCSSSELEMIRRERNRMHAKKTRLRKKKMIQEMETIISSLEKDITDLQGGMISVLPNPETVPDLNRYSPPLTDTADFIKIEKPHGIECSPDEKPCLPASATTSSERESNISTSSQQSHLTRTISVDAPSSSSSKKRKHLAPPPTTEIREKHFSTPNFLSSDPCENGNIFRAPEDRGSQQYLWRQHISKNSIKTVSICSESASGGSEGSLSEGDLSSGSAVHSLLHMSRTNSSDSRGSGSGSDESDSAPSNHATTPSQPNSQSHNRHHLNASRGSDKRTVTPGVAALVSSPSLNVSTPKTIQAILAACESLSPMTHTSPAVVAVTASSSPHAFESLACAQSHPHWRLPERTIGGNLGQTSVDVRIVASTVAAVASIYPITIDTDDSTYRGYIPMKPVDVPGPVPLLDGIRNQKFTVYGGNKPHPTYGASDSNALPSKKRCTSGSFYDVARGVPIPQELDTTEPFPVDPVIQQSLYSVHGYVPGEMTGDDMRHYNLHSLLTKSLSDYSVKKHPTNSPLDIIQTPLEILRSNGTARQNPSEPYANATLDCSMLKSCEVMPPSL